MMRITKFVVAFITMVMGSLTMAEGVADENSGLQLCKEQISKQFKGVDRVRLKNKYFVHVSETDQQRTYYMNGRHWENGRWYNDRVLCVTNINGSSVRDLEKAIGGYVIRKVPVQAVADN